MPHSLDLPLPLYKVLEEEYSSLHGTLSAEETVELPGRPGIVSKPDWRFHRGHVREARALLERLTAPGDEPLMRHLRALMARRFDASPKPSEAELFEMLRRELPAQGGEVAAPARAGEPKAPPPPRPATPLLERALDGLLDADFADFYREELFACEKLGEPTRILIEHFQCHAAGHASSDEERTFLHRKVLEEVFPGLLEKISDVRLAAMYQRFHRRQQSAVSLSGGGIRSGTFSLGLLQGLARHDLLDQFDYLSTVSGGGYVGGWLSAWLQRHPRGLEGVAEELANREPVSKVDPDPAPVRHLRAYSNFITPQVGLFSADTWAFVAIYVRNLMLNWSVFVPLVAFLMLLPRLGVAIALSIREQVKLLHFHILSVPLPFTDRTFDVHPRHLFLVVGAYMCAWALAYLRFNRPSLRPQLARKNPKWAKRADQRGFLRWCLLRLSLAAVCLPIYWAWTDQGTKSYVPFALFGFLVPLFSLVISLRVLRGKSTERWPAFFVRDVVPFIVVGLGGGLLLAVTPELPLDPIVANVDESRQAEWYVCLAFPLFLFVFQLMITLFAGLTSNSPDQFSDEDREWWSRFSAWVVIAELAFLAFGALSIFGPVLLMRSPKLLAALGGVSGLVSLVVARSSKSPATKEEESKGGALAMFSGFMLPLLALVFVAVFAAFVSLLASWLVLGATQLLHGTPLGGDWMTNVIPLDEFERLVGPPVTELMHMRLVHYPSAPFVLLLALGLLAVGGLLSRLINLNLFSLHNGYRNRLIRGFLAASRPPGRRAPNPFTGFDPGDNVYMHELRPSLLHDSDFTDDGHGAILRQLAAARDAHEAAGAAAQEPAGTAAAGAAPDGAPADTPGAAPADGAMAGAAVTGAATPAAPTPAEQVSAHLFASPHLHDTREQMGRDYSPKSGPPQSLKASLREDLNRVIESDEKLYERFEHLLTSPTARRALSEQRREPRPAYQRLLNRLVLEAAFPGVLKASPYPPPPYKLFHVVNTTLNLVRSGDLVTGGGRDLAWQQRKAEPFSFTPLHSGCFRLGYRRSQDYGGSDGITMGTAMTISGAAASSNMGYYTSSPTLSLLLTLFNVRLGWWLGNPGPAGNRTPRRWFFLGRHAAGEGREIYRRMSPTLSLLPVLQEAFGLTDDRNDYVYLTDGGHFENLGLYEMVLRRCRLIVVVDGAEDGDYQFGDLGNAVRKIRIDLGVPIEFEDVPIYKYGSDEAKAGKGRAWAVGKIRYSCVDGRVDGRPVEDGVIVYVKPAVYGRDEPRDVLQYREAHPDFPNQSTGDQFFDEPQFESYRQLGSHVMDQICGEGFEPMRLSEFVERAHARGCDAHEGDRPPYWLKRWLSQWRRKEGSVGGAWHSPS